MVTVRSRRVLGVPLLAVLLGLLVVLAGTLPAGAGTEAAARRARWQLVDYAQSGCFSPNVHDSYYGIYIAGRWTRAIDVGASSLPAGGSYDTSFAPIPPGSSTGEYSLAYVHVMFPTPPPIGVYTASMWASDGRTTEQVPITIDVRSRCGY